MESLMSFDLEQFLVLLEQYNRAIWPLQLLAYILGCVALLGVVKRTKHSGQMVTLVLALFWLWNGAVFCLVYWSRIYPLAFFFGFLWLIQAILLLSSLRTCRLSFRPRSDWYSAIGALFILYALVGYSLLGHFIGHVFPRFFPFGLVPCPTTIFTFGLFLLADKRVPGHLLIIPLFFALSGILAVIWGIYEDVGLVIAGLLGTLLIVQRNRGQRTESDSQPRGQPGR